jgi:DNA-binding transcriptional LysR family regulator
MYPSSARYPWSFERKGHGVEFDPPGPLALHDHELMIEAALEGIALAYVWENRAAPYARTVG